MVSQMEKFREVGVTKDLRDPKGDYPVDLSESVVLCVGVLLAKRAGIVLFTVLKKAWEDTDADTLL